MEKQSGSQERDRQHAGTGSSLFSYKSRAGHNWSSQALTSTRAKRVLPKDGTRPAVLLGKAWD